MHVELVFFDGCPHAAVAAAHLDEAAASLAGLTITRRLVARPEDAERFQLHGSPTILVDGRDLFPDEHTSVSWSCRIYQTEVGPAGAPSTAMLIDALASARPTR